ncbi:unnamed protein product [Medioppia subpectinata]|uniref:Nose resistant-to-fluoxetine protein N-terminal domain-containing protein n=1 Tax=Medioppia subpectinata TaxID=1979941 RepID=A0A7R9KE01_9ACAR|nr:unnamed protein product [Medioppia subpectinata]CAG2101628.1 unnamed protein product [Medioppia subpectinata]
MLSLIVTPHKQWVDIISALYSSCYDDIDHNRYDSANYCRAKGLNINNAKIDTTEYSVDYYLNDSVVTVDEIITDTTNSPEPTTEDDDDYYEYETNNSGYNEGNCANNNIFDKLLDIYNENRDLVVVKNVNNVNKTLDTINRLSKIIFDLSKDLLSVKQLTQLAEIFFSIDIPTDCLLSLIEVVNGIRREELWAIKFIDSMGRIPTGIMEGTVSHFGEFDECLGIESPVNADTLSTQSLIKGQYCLAKIILPYPKKQPLDKRANKNISNKIYFDKLVAFLKNYNMDQYLTVFKLIEILNNQKGATFRFGTCIPSLLFADSGSKRFVCIDAIRFLLIINCNPPTWFLSALFQLQVIAPFIVLMLYRSPKLGVSLTLAIIMFGCYASISPKHLFGQKTYLDPLGISSLEEMTKAFVAFHMGINQYIISFFIGILVGYLVRENDINRCLSRKWEALLWVLSFSTIIYVMYWYMTLHTLNASPPKSSVLLWFSFGKLFACIAISWILFSLCIGRAD